ncbi:MAG: PEGA domain-containing protein [bacterium]|nr:MAG: PEGA domain-containing protein [bacterium]
MKKKLISIFLALLGILVVGYGGLSFLGLFKDQESGILVEADPESIVYINEQEVGRTPYEANLSAGEITLRVKPIDTGIILDDYETKINLTSGVRTIVKRTFKDVEEFSSGVVVSFEKLGGSESYITVVSVPDNAQVIVDNKIVGYTPLRVKMPAGDHNLIVSSDKYLEKSLPIRVYAGYKLTASVKLAKSDVVESQIIEELSGSTDIEGLGKIKVNQTDIGFLRVRSGANTGFPEIGQVKPDEEYEILEIDENGIWYKIEFVGTEGESQAGWVSAEFVTKLNSPN